MSARERCPICGLTADPGLKPFCSERCADVDLARWLSNAYVIPVETDESDEEFDGDDLRPAGQTGRA